MEGATRPIPGTPLAQPTPVGAQSSAQRHQKWHLVRKSEQQHSPFPRSSPVSAHTNPSHRTLLLQGLPVTHCSASLSDPSQGSPPNWEGCSRRANLYCDQIKNPLTRVHRNGGFYAPLAEKTNVVSPRSDLRELCHIKREKCQHRSVMLVICLVSKVSDLQQF